MNLLKIWEILFIIMIVTIVGSLCPSVKNVMIFLGVGLLLGVLED